MASHYSVSLAEGRCSLKIFSQGGSWCPNIATSHNLAMYHLSFPPKQYSNYTHFWFRKITILLPWVGVGGLRGCFSSQSGSELKTFENHCSKALIKIKMCCVCSAATYGDWRHIYNRLCQKGWRKHLSIARFSFLTMGVVQKGNGPREIKIMLKCMWNFQGTACKL